MQLRNATSSFGSLEHLEKYFAPFSYGENVALISKAVHSRVLPHKIQTS